MDKLKPLIIVGGEHSMPAHLMNLNQKGNYAILAALILVVLTSATLLQQQTQLTQNTQSQFTESFFETKLIMQNMDWMLQKRFSDKTAGLIMESCGVPASFQTNMETDLAGLLDSINQNDFGIRKSRTINCALDNFDWVGGNPTDSPAEWNVSFELSCQNELNGLTLRFSRPINIHKEAVWSGSSGNCVATITDLDSEIIEVTKQNQ